MKQLPNYAILFILLFFSRAAVSAQSAPTESYYIVILPGQIVQAHLHEPSFAYFDFRYTQLNNGAFGLEAYAVDNDGYTIGDVIELQIMNDKSPKKLKNLNKGRLILTLATMQQHNVDGSENYVLTPKKCKDPYDGKELDYVSYRFSNRVYNEAGYLPYFGVLGLTSFDLNPSPPYRAK